jgi:hypothetical protein
MNNLTVNNEAATALDIKQLKERREEIASKFQAVADAVKAITGKLPDKSVVLDLVKDQDDIDLRIAVWDLYHRSLNINLPLKYIRTNSIDTAPDQVKDLYYAAEEARGRSDEPGRYYDKPTKEWKGVAVSEEERSMIAQRNQQEFKSQEDLDAYQHLKREVYFLNRSQIKDKKSLPPVKMVALLPHLAPFLEYIRQDSPEFPGPGKYFYEYKVRTSDFLKKGNDYRAFDEYMSGDIPGIVMNNIRKGQFEKRKPVRV